MNRGGCGVRCPAGTDPGASQGGFNVGYILPFPLKALHDWTNLASLALTFLLKDPAVIQLLWNAKRA